MRSQVEACWLPEALEQKLRPLIRGCTPIIKRYERDGDYMDVVFRRLSPEALAYAASFLRDQRNRVLREKSVYEIARALNLAAEKWLDPMYPPRRRAIEHISLITGFSTEMVAHSIDLEQRSSRYEHLVQALVNELGSPDYLDGFQPNANLCGMSQAIGPDLVGAIFSSNIPALPHLEIMRALLVKSSCLGRVSAGEPIFLRLYAETLHEIDPDLASCIVVTYWNHEELDCEKAFLESIDYLVAYGSEAQTERLASVKPPELRASWHGHKVGFTYILREALEEERVGELAQRVAYDFSIFDGYACLCPQVCFVETGGKLSPQAFAEECARWMSDWAVALPPRRLSVSEASRKYQLRELYFARESMNDPVSVIAAPDDFSFTVIIEEANRLDSSPGDRFLKIVPVNGVADAERLLRPLRPYLQCAALAGDAYRISSLSHTLASSGVTRIVPPGLMGTPSMMWHHDGMACLGKMIKWCDYELLPPEKALKVDAQQYVKTIDFAGFLKEKERKTYALGQ